MGGYVYTLKAIYRAKWSTLRKILLFIICFNSISNIYICRRYHYLARKAKTHKKSWKHDAVSCGSRKNSCGGHVEVTFCVVECNGIGIYLDVHLHVIKISLVLWTTKNKEKTLNSLFASIEYNVCVNRRP